MTPAKTSAAAAALSLALASTGALLPTALGAAGNEPPDLNLAVALGYVPTFGAAIANTDLVVELGDAGPYTVFVPSEAAFARLPAGTLQDLQRPENRDALAELLRQHIVRGRVTTADLAGARRLRTLAGTYLEVGADGRSVNDVPIVTADQGASNGVFHVVAAVIPARS